MTDVAEQTRELLTQLGQTPRQVADTLIAAGIKGWPNDGRHCPVAKYLKANTGLRWNVRFGFATYAPHDRKPSQLRIEVPIPDPVYQLTVQFDRGEWPRLEA